MSRQAPAAPQAGPGEFGADRWSDVSPSVEYTADLSVTVPVPDYLAATPSRPGRRRMLVLADQAASTLSNFAVTVLAASSTSPTTFGRFSITMVGYQLAVGVVRAAVGEPLLTQYSPRGPRARRRIVADVHGTTMFLGALCSVAVLVLSLFSEPGLRDAFVGLAVVLPFVLVQDMWRYIFIIDRPGAALAIDLVWLVAVVLGLSLVPAGSSSGLYVVAWGASGALGALAGLALGRGLSAWPHPWKWLAGHRAICWRYLTEFATAQGVGQLTFAGLAAFSGAAALGAARATWTLFGVLVVVNSSLYMVLVPEGARERGNPERMPRKFAVASIGSMALALCWMLAVLVAPDAVGAKVFGETWVNAQRLIVPMGLTMIAGGALSGGLLGVRAMGDPRLSLSARLRSAPFQALCPLVGVVLGDAMGFVIGLAVANLVSAVVWWAAFLRATSRRPGTSFTGEQPGSVRSEASDPRGPRVTGRRDGALGGEAPTGR